MDHTMLVAVGFAIAIVAVLLAAWQWRRFGIGGLSSYLMFMLTLVYIQQKLETTTLGGLSASRLSDLSAFGRFHGVVYSLPWNGILTLGWAVVLAIGVTVTASRVRHARQQKIAGG